MKNPIPIHLIDSCGYGLLRNGFTAASSLVQIQECIAFRRIQPPPALNFAGRCVAFAVGNIQAVSFCPNIKPNSLSSGWNCTEIPWVLLKFKKYFVPHAILQVKKVEQFYPAMAYTAEHYSKCTVGTLNMSKIFCRKIQ